MIKRLLRHATALSFAALLAAAASGPRGVNANAAARAQADVNVNGFYAANRAQQGRTVQAAVVLDIPDGFHVNANRVLNKFSIPTTVKIETPDGVRASAVTFPRAKVQKLGFSKEPLALYDGRAVMRFNVTFPAGFKTGVTELKAKVRYQACNDEICYPPTTREITMPIAVVGPNEEVRPINRQLFGGGRRR
ncbi:MAG TPA: protein-disulfide reductase DsbD N-terminal domain-containing protein [Pyrinomonadaceae bacterium]|nr:protein-disulfide reductase DsbD N-terminal domain-containing protein [Pyrinomonadaceae bacterium]